MSGSASTGRGHGSSAKAKGWVSNNVDLAIHLERIFTHTCNIGDFCKFLEMVGELLGKFYR